MLMRRPVLQLNRSFEPLRIIYARHALTLITKGKAVVVVPTRTRIYPGVYLPSVIRLVDFARVPYRVQQASRKNIFLRDGYRCMYCGQTKQGAELELEHVIPKSRGGPKSWDNLVAACRKCNARKNDRTPEEAGMKLIHRPLPATIHTHRDLLRSLGKEVNEWSPYLWMDSDGDQSWKEASQLSR
jgi:5-methylcytosine-specific restriction endonuclease McrA